MWRRSIKTNRPMNVLARLRAAFIEPRDEPVSISSREMEIIEEYWDAPLEELFKRLIAARDGVRPEDVTGEYIRKQREDRLYPRTSYDIDSDYGGYDSSHLKVLSRRELDALESRSREKFEAVLASSI